MHTPSLYNPRQVLVAATACCGFVSTPVHNQQQHMALLLAAVAAAVVASPLSPSSPLSSPSTGLPRSPSLVPSSRTSRSPTPAFATLAFEKKPSRTAHVDPAILPSSPSLSDGHLDAQHADPKDGASSAFSHDGSSVVINGAQPQTSQARRPASSSTTGHGSLVDQLKVEHETLGLPEILPPSQLTLAELLRQDFDSAVRFPDAICNAADTLITQLLAPAELQPTVDPLLLLKGNCAPVAETPPTPCTIKGTLPADLNGVYLRNGPNATHLFRGDGYHLFDGNGMLHSVKIEDHKATFCARYVKTSRFKQEAAAGRPLFPKFFGGLSGVSGAARTAVVALRAALGLLDVTRGWGLSNTSVGFFNGQVLSLSEDDMPYVIKVTESGDLLTLGHFKLAGTTNMCAHPKFDASTGEMFAFSFHPPSMPPFSFFRVSADGVKAPHVPVPLLDVPLVHDFAITRKYVIFPDNQLVVRPMEVLRGESALAADDSKTPRFCLLPRYALPAEAGEKAQWFEAPGCNCLHYINAWDEGADEVVLITSVLSPPERILELPALHTMCTLTEIRFNTATGKARSRKLCEGNFEFGVLNQKYVGRRCRYVYLASGCYPDLRGVVKVDLEAGGSGGVVARREYDEGCTGGEPFFVPRKGKSREEVVEEDDGYLLCYVHHEGRAMSELLVMDARSPSLEVMARVQLPSRVPSGFHGWFVSQEQLAQQA